MNANNNRTPLSQEINKLYANYISQGLEFSDAIQRVAMKKNTPLKDVVQSLSPA